MLKKLSIFFIIFLFAFADVIGGFASDYTTYGVGSRAAAMGNAGRSIIVDASAIYWNSALVAEMSNLNIFSSATTLLADTAMTNISVCMPFTDHSSIGFSTTMIKTTEIELHNSGTEPCLTPDGYFEVGNELYIFSYAQKINNNLNIGITNKYEKRQIGNLIDGVDMIDFGMLYKFGFGNFGAVLRNVFVYKTGDTEDNYQLDLDIGANLMLSDLLLSFDTAMILTSQYRWYFGAELPLLTNRKDNSNIMIRGGINQNEITFGVGTRLDILDLDYAFVKNEVEVQHRFSLSISLGTRPNVWYLYE